jgi:hypothetical protein
MSIVFTLLPLLLSVAVYAGLIKLASRLYRKSQLAWKHAFAFSAIGMVLGAVGTFLNLLTGSVLPTVLAAMAGIGLQVVLGGWFLGPRALGASGAPVTFNGGAAIAAIAVVFGLVLGVLAAVVMPALIPHGQA